MGQALSEQVTAAVMQFADLKMQLDETDVVCIFGVDEGNIYKSLSSWSKKKENRFIVYIEENEQKFLKAKEFSFGQDPKVRFLFYNKESEEIFQQIAWEFVFLRFSFLCSNANLQDAAQEFFIKLQHYHLGIDLLASDCEDMGYKVLKNVVHNLTALPKSKMGQTLEGVCTGMPAIICGAGPSLNDAIPMLKDLEDKAMLIAGGSAVRALNAQGIKPHLYANIDPHPPFQRFKEQDCFEVPFFYQSRFSHELLDQVHSQLIWFSDSGNYPLESYLSSECGIFSEPFDSGWTVSNFCTSIAGHLGFSKIIFLGMDFSCDKDATYASNLPGEENRNALIELEKDKLYSKHDWLMSAEWMGSFAKKNPDIEWINATTGGLDLPGIKRKSLSEVAHDLEANWDMSAIVHSLVMKATPSSVSLEKIKQIRANIKESFEKSNHLCDALLKVWEKYYPQSPLEKAEYAILEHDLAQEIAHKHFLSALWNIWTKPILRTPFHPLGQHVHKLLFFKKALEMHLPYLRSL